MALNPATLKGLIITELQAKGFATEGEHSKNADLAEAIAKAVVTHITTMAVVPVSGGSSAGNYQVT